jgi:hypothetical protein
MGHIENSIYGFNVDQYGWTLRGHVGNIGGLDTVVDKQERNLFRIWWFDIEISALSTTLPI